MCQGACSIMRQRGAAFEAAHAPKSLNVPDVLEPRAHLRSKTSTLSSAFSLATVSSKPKMPCDNSELLLKPLMLRIRWTTVIRDPAV